MPILTSNIQSYVREKRIQNIKQKYSKATDKMLVTSGLNGYDSTASFVKELQKHLKIAQVCDNANISKCWPTEKVILEDGSEWQMSKTTSGKSLRMVNDENNEWDNTVALITADGTPYVMSYNKKCNQDETKSVSWNENQSSSTNCTAMVFDWNGGKNPNRFNGLDSKSDVIAFNANGLGYFCLIEVGGKCFGSFFKPECISKTECEELKAQGKLSYCGYDSDCWAGAVRQCGGKDNMPTTGDLLSLYNALKEGDYTANTSALGLPTVFTFWSSEELASGKVAWPRTFYPTTLGGTANGNRNHSGHYAVCLE